jgi:predicted RNase H-like HicB family nuclease
MSGEVQTHEVEVKGKTYKLTLTPDHESGGFTVESPDVQGAISHGDNVEEGITMGRDAIQAILDDIEAEGKGE